MQVDPAAISGFVSALFRYADEDSFVTLRAFDQVRRDVPPVLIWPVKVGSGLAYLTEIATRAAQRSADTAEPSVFAPPIATFSNPKKARGVDLANGLSLSVEVDDNPQAAKACLEQLLGPATVAVESGSVWIDPETGELQPKLHLHWRLSEATHDEGEHLRLHMARSLAQQLIGADPTGTPVVHPLRWPGSWNRKSTPILARMVEVRDEVEIHLADALERLEDAVSALPGNDGGDKRRQSGASAEAEDADLIAEAFPYIPNDAETHYDFWIRMGYAAWRATGGSDDGYSAWEVWSRKSSKFDQGETEAAWKRIGAAIRGTNPARKIGAGTIFYHAKLNGWVRPARHGSATDDAPEEPPPHPGFGSGWKQRHSREEDEPFVWQEPVDFLTDDTAAPPELQQQHVPDALWGFIADTAERMGVEPAAVALGSIVSCASVISDEWQIQPKRYDYTWTENARLWGAIIGDPGIKKSPVIAACTKPIDRLEAKARTDHAEQVKAWRIEEAAAKCDKLAPPPKPKCDRYMVENATIEALSEVLRDDEEARFRVPCRKVLSRHDEMSELVAGFDRYRAGGKGGSDRGAYLRLYNGGRFVVDRVGRGSFAVPDWSACLLGGIQPGPIQRIAREAADDGLLQRFMYCVATRQQPGCDRAPDQGAEARYAALFPAMVAMHPTAAIGADFVRPVVFHADAHQHREDVDALAIAVALMPDTSNRLKASLDKWPGLFARLCLTFHLIEVADCRASGETAPFVQVIPEAVAARVAAFMREIVLPHLLRAEAVMFATEQTGHTRWIAGYILAHGLERVAIRDITRNYKALRAPEAKRELVAVMDGLVSLAWLEPEPPSNPVKGVSSWLVNPAVHVAFAERTAGEADRRREARQRAAEAFARARKKSGKDEAAE